MNICPHCQTMNDDAYQFCVSCGKPINNKPVVGNRFSSTSQNEERFKQENGVNNVRESSPVLTDSKDPTSTSGDHPDSYLSNPYSADTNSSFTGGAGSSAAQKQNSYGFSHEPASNHTGYAQQHDMRGEVTQLGYETVRFISFIFGFWLLNLVFSALPFVKQMDIPETSLSASGIISSTIYILILLQINSYKNKLDYLWVPAFPNFSEALDIWSALAKITLLGLGYKAALPVIYLISSESGVIFLLQVILLVISALIAYQGAKVFNQMIPRWVDCIFTR